MTSQTYSNEPVKDNKTNEIINIRLFLNHLKRDKILILLLTISTFLISPLVIILTKANNSNWRRNELLYSSTFDTISILLAILSSGAAIIGALYMYHYLHNRKAAIFHAALPVKRHTLYITKFAAGVVYYFAASVINYIISLFFILDYMQYIGDLTAAYIKAFLVFMCLYTLMILAANLAGNVFSSVVVFAFNGFALTLIIVLLEGFFSTFYTFANLNIYSDSRLIFNTSVILRPYYLYRSGSINISDVLVTLLISASAFFIGIFLNKIVKTEHAEKSIYFKPYENTLKYVIIALSAMLSAIIFYASFDYFGMYISLILIGFLTLIILNIIINRNIKDSFKNIKTFVIFMAVLSVVITPFAFDMFNYDTYIPDSDKVKAINFNDYNYYNYSEYYSGNGNKNITEITDKEAIKAFCDITKFLMEIKVDFDYYYSYTEDEEYNRLSFSALFPNLSNVKYELKFGLPVDKRFHRLYFDRRELNDEIYGCLYTLYNNAAFKKVYFYPLYEDFLNDCILDDASNITLDIRTDSGASGYSLGKKDSVAELLNIVRKDASNFYGNIDNIKSFQMLSVWESPYAIYIRSTDTGDNEYYAFNIPIMPYYSESIEFIKDNFDDLISFDTEVKDAFTDIALR